MVLNKLSNFKKDNKLMSGQDPVVSIGMPVYNAQNYIREALESILAQTFTGFELIISDNASTDATGRICRAYAQKDARIRYYRNQVNLGADPNYNKIFKLSKGKYFKWAAHDDVIAPDFLEKCVDVLDRDKSIVICCSNTGIIDENSALKRPFPVILRTDSRSAGIRFFELLIKPHASFSIFGLIRSDRLKKTPLFGGYASSDKVLLARLALMGRFHEIPEMLFLSRDHGDQSVKMLPDLRRYAVWFNEDNRGKILFPYWRIALEYMKSPFYPAIAGGLRVTGVAAAVFFSLMWMAIKRGELLKELLQGCEMMAKHFLCSGKDVRKKVKPWLAAGRGMGK